MYKNINKQEKLQLKDQVQYQPGQVVSKTLVQNDKVNHVTYECQTTGKMAFEKWYKESHESEYGTMNWYALDKLPKKVLFVCRLYILHVKLFCK